MTRKMATFGQGGWCPEVSITKESAEKEFGAAIPDAAWKEISAAWERHYRNKADLEGTRLNNNRNDPNGWARRKKDTERRLRVALVELDGLNQDFLSQAVDNLEIQGRYQEEFLDWRRRLDRARDDILMLHFVTASAEPLGIEVLTDSESRKRLAGQIFAALKPHGATVSNGFALGQTEASHADLTGFERLIELMGVHQGDTPSATSKWVREAVAQKR